MEEASEATPEDPRPIETLLDYEILGLAGSGGMGRVYRARDRKLGRTVAIKVLHPDKVADARERRRLLREARAYSALHHPAIVSVYAAGSDQGLDFIAMEWVSGRLLAEEMAAGPLPVDRALSFARQLAGILAAVHHAGMVHRDLKPGNIMIEDGGHLKLLDFGIAKVEGAIDETTLTGTDLLTRHDGAAPGTIAYMAPEQALGEPVDGRADIFSLGVILYEMLAGRRPFGGDSTPALVRQILFAAPQPLRRVRADVPEGLEDVVLRALAKKPEDRPATAESLETDLRHLWPATGSRRWTGRLRRWGSSLARGTVLAACALLVRPDVPPYPTTSPAASAAPASDLPETPYELYAKGEQLLGRYDREGYLDLATRCFERAIERAPEYAPAHAGLAFAYLRRFYTDRDRVWLNRAAAQARRALDLDPLLTDARVARAGIRTAEGDREEARAELEELRKIDPDDPQVLVGLAAIALDKGDLPLAENLYEQAIKLSPRSWEIQSDLGRVLAAESDFRGAEAAFRKAVELAPDNAFLHRNLGAVLHYEGRYGEAVTELQKAITIRPTARAYSNLGTAYYFQGLYDEAAAALEKARALGANNYLFWANLGDAYRQVPRKRRDAPLCFERAIQLLRSEMTAAHPDPVLASRMALYLAKSGRTARALREIAAAGPLASASADVAYRATLVFTLAGEKAKALRAVEIALSGGYPMVEVMNEPDLTELRKDVAFQEIAVRFDTTAAASGPAP